MLTGTSQIFRVYLSSAVPLVTNTSYSSIPEISAGNGYTALGPSIGTITGSQASGTFAFSATTNPTWTASGGSIGAFQYAILYNASVSGTPLVGWWDYGAAITLTNGNTFTVTLPSPILTI